MKAIKVKFRDAGKRYYFSPRNLELHDKDKVVVETTRGCELGFCVGEIFDVDEAELRSELKDILRKADDIDIRHYEDNVAESPIVLGEVKKLVIKNKLQMKLLSAEYTLERAKLIIQFTSDDRVDFRQLVKDIAELYHARIELRQVGNRDGSKILGGIGPCGLVLCCKQFLTEFDNVSIKVAKNQNLSLNPVKISGNCDKLLCCIKYEDDLYKELRNDAPKVNKLVLTPEGKSKVLSVDVLNRACKVKNLDTDKYGYYSFDDIKYGNIK